MYPKAGLTLPFFMNIELQYFDYRLLCSTNYRVYDYFLLCIYVVFSKLRICIAYLLSSVDSKTKQPIDWFITHNKTCQTCVREREELWRPKTYVVQNLNLQKLRVTTQVSFHWITSMINDVHVCISPGISYQYWI